MATKKSLTETLAEIDARLVRVLPDAVPSLRPAADARSLERLAELCGGPIPEDLATWFGWHDGQADSMSPGIDPESPAITWFSIDGALEEHAFLVGEPEKMLPWDDRWLPIATNGGGDSYVYALAGPQAGTILFYLHDSERRSVVAKSLAKLAETIAKNLAARDQPKVDARLGALTEPLVKARAPSPEDVREAPIGTCYYRRSLPYRSYWYRLYVKVTRTAWVEGKARLPKPDDDDHRIDGAVADANERLSRAPVEWRVKPSDIVFALSDAQVWPSGLHALEGQDPRKDRYFVRLRGRLAIG